MRQPDDIALPQRLLLANDLSHRCDRALDRAALLARQWRVPLLSLTALERGELLSLPGAEGASLHSGSEARIVAERRVRQDLDDADIVLDVRVEQGNPAECILAVAQPDDLILTGIASSPTLGSILLGNTTDRVVRRSPAPVLVVRQRGRRPYRRILVATDFSESSRRALYTALALFPDTGITLFHAHHPSFGDQSTRGSAIGEQAQAFVAEAGLDAEERRRITLRLEPGSVEALLGDYVREIGTDLIVMGSHGSTATFETLIGGTARRVLESASTDVLIVRDPRAQT